MVVQKELLDRSSRFAQRWLEVLYLSPDLDYTLTHPISQAGRQVYLEEKKQEMEVQIQGLSKTHGLFFFFSSGCSYCKAFAPMVKIFAQKYDWRVLAISMDGTRLPFYKILNVATAYRRGGSPIDILDYAELGAIDILFQYLSEILDVIQESVNHLEISQVDNAQITKFQRSLEMARGRVTQRPSGSFKQIEQIIGIFAKTELLEKSLMVKVGAPLCYLTLHHESVTSFQGNWDDCDIKGHHHCEFRRL